MLEVIISSKARIVLLKVLLLDPSGRFYLRELVGRTGLPQGSVQRELANLAAAGIAVREKSGRQTYYSINERCPIVPDLRSMFVKTVGAADALREALQPEVDAVRAAFIFGSFARGDATPESDVDLFVIGSLTLRRLTALLKGVDLSRAINPVVMSEEEFASRRRSDDHFVSTVLEAPKVFVIGGEDDLAGLAA